MLETISQLLEVDLMLELLLTLNVLPTVNLTHYVSVGLELLLMALVLLKIQTTWQVSLLTFFTIQDLNLLEHLLTPRLSAPLVLMVQSSTQEL